MLQEIISKLSPREIQERFSLKQWMKEDPTSWECYFDDIKLGEAHFDWNEFENYFQWNRFEPLSTALARPLAKGEAINYTKRSYGLGTLAHTFALFRAVQEAPSLIHSRMGHMGIPTDGRVAHLEKMGINYSFTYLFSEYLDLSTGYAHSKGFSFLEKPF